MAHRLSRVATIALAVAALAPFPAAARDRATSEMAEKMQDPRLQHTMAAAVRAMSDAMLDMRVGPLLRAAESVNHPVRGRHIDPDTTLRDYAGPEAERMPEEMSRQVPKMMGQMGRMAGAFDDMVPELKGMAREMGARMGAAMAGAGDDGAASDEDRREDRRGGPDAERGRDRGDAPDAVDQDIPSAQEE
ncbi:hypothetical protein ACFO0A_04510 [Novosphingobium tardum]|uniref:Uncharacterized protein n=1 Tax=Novosphingobium tardum TaxID=1538021 RepID=A0ABV8RLQ2_9SPHN